MHRQAVYIRQFCVPVIGKAFEQDLFARDRLDDAEGARADGPQGEVHRRAFDLFARHDVAVIHAERGQEKRHRLDQFDLDDVFADDRDAGHVVDFTGDELIGSDNGAEDPRGGVFVLSHLALEGIFNIVAAHSAAIVKAGRFAQIKCIDAAIRGDFPAFGDGGAYVCALAELHQPFKDVRHHFDARNR